MSNLTLSLVAGYPVEAPEVRRPAGGAGFSFSAFLERLSNRMYAAERRRMEGDVAAFIERNGGQITDDVERQIGRRFGV